MRVRISFDALRLCLLVAAGVTSGYLWRAAFESSSPEIRLVGQPRIVQQAPVPPVVRVHPTPVRRHTRVVRHSAVGRRAARIQPASEQLASRPVGPTRKPTPAPRRPKPPVPTAPPPTSTPTPAPPPTSRPQPTPPVQ